MKKSRHVISLILVFGLLFPTCAFATQYVAGGGNSLSAYGYGCDFSGTSNATANPSGYWTDVTGTKSRCAVYKNGVLFYDTSEISASLSVTCSGSLSTNVFSNTWKLNNYKYLQLRNSTSYTLVVVTEDIKSN